MTNLQLRINTKVAPISLGNIGIRLPGPPGVPGVSAYESAALGGYTASEEQFYSDLRALQDLAAALEALL
jgi:hypothetical protein